VKSIGHQLPPHPMNDNTERVRVLYSFPNKLGGARICYTAWQQVNGLAAAGADLLVAPASTCRPVPDSVALRPTLAWGRARIPFKLLGNSRAHALHDYLVARRVEKLAGQVDIIHTWPSGARRTLEAAAKAGIPTVLERCNSHTRYVYEVVQKESDRLGVHLPPGHENAFNEDVLQIEEQEFQLADRLLCPSDFVVQTFLDRGFSRERLARHIYGFDEKTYCPSPKYEPNKAGLRMLFVGLCAVRKGVHYALEAWLRSPVHRDGIFTIAGEFLPDYAKKLAPMLSDPSVRILGQRDDVPELMRNSDVLVLPSIEEGFGLVCTEAMGSGCVPLVSDACTDFCKHMENSLVHRVGDVEALTEHISLIDRDRDLLHELRSAGLKLRKSLTWDAAGIRLLDVYRETINVYSKNRESRASSESLSSLKV
jgi:glycosyltransferase involved in cell wall biosynthesis